MALTVRNVALAVDEDPDEVLLGRVAGRLKVPRQSIACHAVVHRALDARRHDQIRYVYTVELSLAGGQRDENRCLRRLRGRNVARIQPVADDPPEPGLQPLDQRPVIVGFGPAGMFAALRLAEYGYRPLVLERGRDVRRRHKDILQGFYREREFNAESNLLYGEGGAGTYSDGKVYTRIHDPAVREVLAMFCRFGADPDILVSAKPHIGSDRLPTICRRLREHIEQLGGDVRFDARVEDLEITDGRLTGLRLGAERLPVGPVLLGIGHSARDTLQMLRARGVELVAKPFQLGVRVEHPQAMVDRWQYGPACERFTLPAADYRLVARGAAGEGRDLFSFCMCPGGMILPTNESPGLISTNGASRASRRSPFANSGLVITIEPREVGNDPLAGLALQEKWERAAFAATRGTYQVPAQRCADFLAGRCSDGTLETSYPLGGQWASLSDLLPDRVNDALRRGLPMLDSRMKGFAGMDGIITAPETRASAPVRIVRDSVSRESVTVSGLYPIGEGAGYAGGIVSAAIDGLRSADRVIRLYRPS